jgi:hypothetical protein
MHETILQSVGKTPLVRLRRVTEGRNQEHSTDAAKASNESTFSWR